MIWHARELYANNVQDTCDISRTTCVFRDVAGALNLSPWESAKCCSLPPFVEVSSWKRDLTCVRVLR
jgi:hypothetical protein